MKQVTATLWEPDREKQKLASYALDIPRIVAVRNSDRRKSLQFHDSTRARCGIDMELIARNATVFDLYTDRCIMMH